MTEPKFIPLATYREYPEEEMTGRTAAFLADMQRRRTVRHFSNRSVPREVIESCLLSAGTAPRGAKSTTVASCRCE